MRIDLQALIRESKELLEELQNGTHQIITRASPATWEDLRSYLETNLVPILKRLYDKIGGLMEQPHVVLPDGVTSTSLVSQSEMTQFVTDTLNTWLGDLYERVEKATKDTIYKFLPTVVTYKRVPKVISVSFTNDIRLPNLIPNISVSKINSVTRKNIIAGIVSVPTEIITVRKE